jgi:hypothetical protein
VSEVEEENGNTWRKRKYCGRTSKRKERLRNNKSIGKKRRKHKKLADAGRIPFDKRRKIFIG